MGAIFNVGRFMSPVQEMKDHRGKCILYGSLPQETGGLTPMMNLIKLFYCSKGLSSLSSPELKAQVNFSD